MSDKEKEKAGPKEQHDAIKEKIERAKQDIPFSERVKKVQPPDPWPDPPPSEQQGGDKGGDD